MDSSLHVDCCCCCIVVVVCVCAGSRPLGDRRRSQRQNDASADLRRECQPRPRHVLIGGVDDYRRTHPREGTDWVSHDG